MILSLSIFIRHLNDYFEKRQEENKTKKKHQQQQQQKDGYIGIFSCSFYVCKLYTFE